MASKPGFTVFLCFSTSVAVLTNFLLILIASIVGHTGSEGVHERFSWKIEAEITNVPNDKDTHRGSIHFFPVVLGSSLLGGLFGAIIAGNFGSKRCFLISPILGAASVALMWLMEWIGSYNTTGVFFSQLLAGLYGGLNTILVPLYLVEISPLHLRGTFGTLHQFSIFLGVWMTDIMGHFNMLLYADHMPIVAVVRPIVLLLLGAQLALFPFCAESPRHILITKQKEDEARRELQLLRSSRQIEDEIEEMRSEQRSQLSKSIPSTLRLSFFKKLSMPILITVVLQFVVPFSGIDVFTHNTWSLFMWAGFTDFHYEFANLGTKTVEVIMVFISMVLMDRVGRRNLLLCSVGGMFISSIFFTLFLLLKLSYPVVFFKLSFRLFYDSGVGCISQFITAELFTQGPRPIAMFIAYFSREIYNIVGSIFFFKINIFFGNFILIPFSILLALFFLFIHKFIPETKNKTFGNIFILLENKTKPSDNMVVVFKRHLDEPDEVPLTASASYHTLT